MYPVARKVISRVPVKVTIADCGGGNKCDGNEGGEKGFLLNCCGKQLKV